MILSGIKMPQDGIISPESDYVWLDLTVSREIWNSKEESV